MRGLAGLGLLLLTACSGGAPMAPAPSGALVVLAKDNVFAPREVVVTPGQPVFVRDTGAAPHTFTVKELHLDIRVDAGRSSTVTFPASARGTFRIVCTYHESLGMVGTLTFR